MNSYVYMYVRWRDIYISYCIHIILYSQCSEVCVPCTFAYMIHHHIQPFNTKKGIFDTLPRCCLQVQWLKLLDSLYEVRSNFWTYVCQKDADDDSMIGWCKLPCAESFVGLSSQPHHHQRKLENSTITQVSSYVPLEEWRNYYRMFQEQ